jgi:hypothetical protein
MAAVNKMDVSVFDYSVVGSLLTTDNYACSF